MTLEMTPAFASDASSTQPTQSASRPASRPARGLSSDAQCLPVDASGEYVMLEPVGQGGMGQVFRARETRLQRDVAIKFLLKPDDRQRHRRFIREARAAARLEHENIARIYRFGIWPAGASCGHPSGDRAGQPYLVEEYVRGQNLAQMATPMPWTRVLDFAPGIAAGLAAAHRCGVLHRDIKPANVIITYDDVAKIIDFGLAQVHGVDAAEHAPGASEPLTGDAAITRDGALIGTPRYLAPELWAGEPPSVRSDMYSLGVLLHELCAGRRTSAASVADGAGPTLPALRTTRPDIDMRLSAIIDRCLARDPADRFESVDAIADALTELAQQHGERWPVTGEPYRGLLPFEPEHHRLFFGRSDEIRALVARVRTEPLLLVAGSSGVGKSSLVRAGLLPTMTRCHVDGRRWHARVMVPGRHPGARLAAELARMLNAPEDTVAFEMAHDMAALTRRARAHGRATPGMVLVLDQLEELVTVAERAEAEMVARVLVALAERVSTMRVIATVRDDRLADVARLPGLGDQLERGRVVLVRAPDAHGLRAAIIGPASLQGVRFADRALVDTLVAATEKAPGGQFDFLSLREILRSFDKAPSRMFQDVHPLRLELLGFFSANLVDRLVHVLGDVESVEEVSSSEHALLVLVGKYLQVGSPHICTDKLQETSSLFPEPMEESHQGDCSPLTSHPD